MNEFLSWCVALLGTLVSWLGTMQIVEGVTLLGFLGASFILAILIRNLIYKAR